MMVTLRRAVTKMKSFRDINPVDTRVKLLETFINKVVEINQRKAIQKDPPLKMREVMDIAKDYMENVSDYVRSFGKDNARDRKEGFQGASTSRYVNQGRFNKNFKGPRNDSKMEELTRKFLSGHKICGREFCINYNLQDHKGEPRCKDRKCSRAHNCGFIPRGQNTPCGKLHPKFEHSRN